MTDPRPGILSIRAINQYRRRDVLSYLGLRYYLASSAAQADNWAERAAVDVALARSGPAYFRSLHFKEVNAQQMIEHRQISLPAPNEALAEAALLDQCAGLPEAFANPPCVYSYELARGSDQKELGIFKPYFEGYLQRHGAIAAACDACPDGIVQYVDIKRFYPSITADIALAAWRGHADLGNLGERYRDLGEKLIRDHEGGRAPGDKAILTGPMFSHLLANLVLRPIDLEFAEAPSVKYFRYVDDFVLVGERASVRESLATLNDRLGRLGLELYDDSSPHKFIEVPCGDWLVGRDDFKDDAGAVSWKALIGGLKGFLLNRAAERQDLHGAFLGEGLRIPTRDYSGLARETTFLERIDELAEFRWFRRKVQTTSISSLVRHALSLRNTYERELRTLLAGAADLTGFDRKRRIPRLRFLAARLVYLATEESLASLATAVRELPELHLHAEVMAAVASGDISGLLASGANAAQAAAQPLRAANRPARLSLRTLDRAAALGLAVFHFNGVPVSCPALQEGHESELLRFAKEGVDVPLMRSLDPFVRELACLHGLSAQPRHADLIETAFDRDELLALDAVDQLQQSQS